MAKDEVSDVGMGFEEFLAEGGDPFCHSFSVGLRRAFEFPAVGAPVVGKGDGPSGMNSGEQFLTEFATEQRPEQFERRFQFSDPVAVSQEKFFSVDFLDRKAVDDFHPEFGGEVVEDPDVVVSDKPDHANPPVGEFGDFSEEADKPTWDYIPILIPIVKDVAEEINHLSVILDTV